MARFRHVRPRRPVAADPLKSDGIAATYQASAPAGTSPWRLWRSRDGGRTWRVAGALPGGTTDIYGPWFSASGDGLLLAVTGGIPWQPGSGATPPVRVWTTANWGSSWTRSGLLPLSGDTITGAVSFAGRSGWLVVQTAAFQQLLAVTLLFALNGHLVLARRIDWKG